MEGGLEKIVGKGDKDERLEEKNAWPYHVDWIYILGQNNIVEEGILCKCSLIK